MATDIYAGYDAFTRSCFDKFDRGIIVSPFIRTFGGKAYRVWLKIKQRQTEAEASALVEIKTPEPPPPTPKTIKEKYEFNLNYLTDFVDKIVDILKTEIIPEETDDTTKVDSSILENTETPDSPNTERKQTAKDIIERLKLFLEEIPDDITLDTINLDNFLFSLSYKKIALLKNKITDDTKTLTNPELEVKKNELLIYMIPVLQEVNGYFTLSFLDEKVEYLNKIFENYTPFVLQNIDNNRSFYFSYNFVDFKLTLYMYMKSVENTGDNENSSILENTNSDNSSILENTNSKQARYSIEIPNTVQPNPAPTPEENTDTEDLTIPETDFFIEIQKKRYDSEGMYLPYKTFQGFNDKVLSNVFNYIDKLWLLDTYCNKN